MVHLAGKTGAIYYRKATITGTGLAFVDSDPDTITDTGNGFVTAGFEAGDLITVTESANNNDTFEIDTGGVAAGTLTLVAGDTLTAEGAGASVTIQEALPGTELAGFSSWSLDYNADALETTHFGDSGKRTYIPGLTTWSATAEKYWLTTENQNEWPGTEKLVRFFILYDAAPNVTTVYYWEGSAVVTGISPAVAVDSVITQTVTFQGTATLTPTTRTTAWPT